MEMTELSHGFIKQITAYFSKIIKAEFMRRQVIRHITSEGFSYSRTCVLLARVLHAALPMSELCPVVSSPSHTPITFFFF